MATVANQNEDTSGTTSPISTSGGQPTGSGNSAAGSTYFSPSGGGAQGGAAKPTSSGSFQNISALLNANKGSNLGSNIANQYENQANQNTASAQNTENSYDTAANNAAQAYGGGGSGASVSDTDTANANANINNVVNGSPGGTSTTPNYTPVTAATAGSPSNATATQTEFGNQLNASFNAPAANYSTQQNQAQQLQQTAQAANTATGQQALLQQYIAPAQYTAGESNVDQLLLQSDPKQQAQIAALRQYGNQQAQGINNIQNATNATGAAYQGQAAAINANANNALTNAYGGVLTGLQTGATNANTNFGTSATGQALADYQSGNLTAADLAALGGGTYNAKADYGLTPQQMASAGITPTAQMTATASNFATTPQANQLAYYQSLAGLGGTNQTAAYNNAATTAGYVPGQAGAYASYLATPATVNASGAANAVATQQADYQAAMQAAANQTYQNALSQGGNESMADQIAALAQAQGAVNTQYGQTNPIASKKVGP